MFPKLKKEKQAVNQNLKHFLVDKHWMWLFQDSKPAVGMFLTGIIFFAVAFATHFTMFAALGLVVAIFGVLMFMVELYQFDKSYFACTDRDFLNHLQTIVSFSDTTLHYHLIREVHIKQSMAGQMFGYAQVTLDSGGDDKVVLPYVKNHQQVKEYLITRIGPPASIKQPAPIVTDGRGELKTVEVPDYKKEDAIPIDEQKANKETEAQMKSHTTVRLPKSSSSEEDGLIYSRK